MKRPSFLHGVVFAAGAALIAGLLIGGLTPFVEMGDILRLSIPGLGLCYLLYLLQQSEATVGKLSTVSLWSALAIIVWWFSPPLPVYLLIHAGAIWLVRSLYFYAGFLPAVADLVLSLLALAGLVWAASRTGSVVLTTWSFFLIHALFVWIPAQVAQKRRDRMGQTNERFERAEQQAEAAVRQLLNT